MRAIIYTRHDGGVAICHPAPECIRAMSVGGYWDDMPRGFVETQINRQIADGILPDAARRFARAVAFGGLSTPEALEVIRDRDCGHLGVAHDLWDCADLPERWFRDAWRRSHNGGPIQIDMSKARRIQAGKIEAAAKRTNKKRSGFVAQHFDGAEPISLDWGRIAHQIKKASDADELRRVWPEGLDIHG